MPDSERDPLDRPLSFRVRFRGTLSATWLASLRGFTLSTSRKGKVTETTITGEVPDEAALLGLVNMLYQFGCPLISVESLESDTFPKP